MTVSRVGQATFFSSAQLSVRYRRMPVNTIGSYFLLRRDGEVVGFRWWQGRQDLNLQPLVLETSALPLSYTPPESLPYFVSRCS